MVGTWGLEPQTSTVSRQRSNQLSYAPTRQRFYHRAGSLAPPAPQTILVDVQFPNRSGSSDFFFVFAHPAVQSGSRDFHSTPEPWSIASARVQAAVAVGKDCQIHAHRSR